MNKKLLLYLFIGLVFTACKSNVVKISGTIENPVNGTYLILDELKSNELKPVDSVKVSEDGKFNFRREIKQASFYLLKRSTNNFLTMLIEPGEKITMKVQNDSLNYPISLNGSKGTELMTEYNRTLRITIKKLTGLNEIYKQNADKPELPKVI
jgi:hypothetical protein